MILIHPHWQSTDATPPPPPPLKKEAVHIHISQASGSRRPAAIFGVSLFVLLLGTLLLQSTRTLTGQLTEPSASIRIATGRLDPASVTVAPGATITWKNTDTKPHILFSDTLQTDDGLLYSPAIFPEEEFRATLSAENRPGEHSYISLTDPTISGTVRIEEARTSPTPLPPPTPPSSAIPQNPFVAATHTIPPADAAPAPLASRTKPFRNPETGIPLGVSFLATLAVVLFLARRILRSPHARIITQ